MSAAFGGVGVAISIGLALALGLFSSAVFAADAPLKVGTTAAFAIPLEAAVEEADRAHGGQVLPPGGDAEPRVGRVPEEHRLVGPRVSVHRMDACGGGGGLPGAQVDGHTDGAAADGLAGAARDGAAISLLETDLVATARIDDEILRGVFHNTGDGASTAFNADPMQDDEDWGGDLSADFSDDAIYNTAYCYDQAGRLDDAIGMREFLVTKMPNADPAVTTPMQVRAATPTRALWPACSPRCPTLLRSTPRTSSSTSSPF